MFSQAGFQIDWHTIEKLAWAVGAAFVTAILTIARPWLAKQILKLLREDKASYKEFSQEVWADLIAKLEIAADDATEALRKVGEMREKIERLESASEEQGKALSDVPEMTRRVTRMGEALEAFMYEFNEAKVLMARLEERQKARQSGQTTPQR